MKIEEAIKPFKAQIRKNALDGITMGIDALLDIGNTLNDENDTMRLIIDALEKQIPRKIKNKRENGFANQIYADCPVCENAVYTDEKYCSGCGQALKWE